MTDLFRWRGLCRATLLWAAALTASHAAPFHFVALGDTAYNQPADEPVYAALIERINRDRPAFTIHIGDVWGAADCLDEDHQRILEGFARFAHPLIYTPGDNEWTDCIDPAVLAADERIDAGRPEPGDQALLDDFLTLKQRARRPGGFALDSLARVRRTFFATPHSLGQRPLPVTRQSAAGPYSEMVENARWTQAGVMFATVHVVGSMNGLSATDSAAATAAVRRNQANVAWIEATFDEAERTGAKAVVLAMHASFFDRLPPRGQSIGRGVQGGRSGPFNVVATAIQERAAAFRKPVLLIHGDDHEFTIDRPFLARDSKGERFTGTNVTRLQVFGSPEVRAVRIGVDPDAPWVFSFAALYNE